MRAKLILWNTVILLASIVVFGVILVTASRARMENGIDNDLMMRARSGPMAPNPPGMGPNGNPNGPPQGGPQGGPQGNRDPQMSLRRPRVFMLDGSPRNPQVDVEPFDREALDAAIHGRTGYKNIIYQGNELRIYTMRIPGDPNGDRPGFIVQTARELREIQDMQRDLVGTLLLVTPVALLLSVLGAWFLAGRAMKPIAVLQSSAAEITATDLSKRLEVKGKDEFARLTQTLNSMLGRVESGVDLERQVFRSQRQFLADASHEMRTPLTRLKLSLDQQPANVGAAQHATKSLGRLVDDLTLLANSDAGRLPMRQESIDARVVVSDALQLFDDSRIEAEFADHAVTVHADADQLMRLTRNLLENALRYARTKVSVRVKQTGLEIEDDGPGISPEDQERVFDRFVRLDESRTGQEGGAGLGLSIVRAIADAHGFEISLISQPGKGTTFFLTW